MFTDRAFQASRTNVHQTARSAQSVPAFNRRIELDRVAATLAMSELCQDEPGSAASLRAETSRESGAAAAGHLTRDIGSTTAP